MRALRFLVLGSFGLIGCGGLTSADRDAPGAGSAPRGAYLSYERVAHQALPTDNLYALCVPPQVVGTNCDLIEAKPMSGDCTCDAPLRPASDSTRAAVKGNLCDAPQRAACADVCLCERTLAASAFALNENCPAVEPYAFAISEQAQDVLVSCDDQRAASYSGSVVQRAVGEACTPSVERDPTVSITRELSLLDVGSPQCESGLCLAYQFQGRTDCPYGTLEGDCSAEGGPSATGAIAAQLTGRRAKQAVTCSCRCDGPNPCACPSGMVCESLFAGPGSDLPARGGYCVFPPCGPSALCNQALANCEG